MRELVRLEFRHNRDDRRQQIDLRGFRFANLSQHSLSEHSGLPRARIRSALSAQSWCFSDVGWRKRAKEKVPRRAPLCVLINCYYAAGFELAAKDTHVPCWASFDLTADPVFDPIIRDSL